MGLWQDHDQGVGQDTAGIQRRLSPGMRRPLAVEGEKLRQDFIGGVQTVRGQRIVKGPDTCMPLIAAIGEGNPIERVHKKASHRERLGRP